MTDLQECRRKIDEIDNQMVELFEKRMKVCEEVAEYKIHTGKKVLDPEREHAKLEEIRKKAHGEFNELGAQELFQQIMAISRKRQYQLLTEYGPKEEEDFQMVEQLPRNNVTVVFQGVEGAYSYGAMRAYFQEDIESYHVKLFRDAMEEVAAGRADYAVLPIENSTAGIVADIYDLLTEYNLFIVGEQILKVEHVLLGLPEAELSDIAGVYSHPQGLAQCKEYLEEHFETTITDEAKVPAILYNVPSRTGCSLAASTVAYLAKNAEYVTAIKEASGDISHAADIMHACDGAIDLYSGNDDQIVPILSLGGKGVISVLSNVAPKETHDIVALFMEGKVKESCELQLKALPLVHALFSEVNPIPVKAALNLMGKEVGPLRLPLTEMEAAHQAVLAEEMRKFGIKLA